MLLRKLTEHIDGAILSGNGNIDIIGIEHDSRQIKDGMMFVAVNGYETDGNRFIPDAIEKGAVAVLTEKSVDNSIPSIQVTDIRIALSSAAAALYGYPGKQLYLVGVTGTNGKSTSVYLIRRIFETAGHKTGMLNSLVYDIGGKSFPAERTTPEATLVQKYMRGMLQSGCTHGVIEVSSHALYLMRVENIDFKIGLFTNFSRDHLDFHKTMDAYLNAKKMLLEKLHGDRLAVVNVDIPEFAAFNDVAPGSVLTYSAGGHQADVMIDNILLSPTHSKFDIKYKDQSVTVHFPLPGRYNIENAAGAAAAAIGNNIDLETVGEGLSSAEAVPGRFEPVTINLPFSVIIDYAHTPDAIARLCQSAREITSGQLMILFGCGGDRDKGKRPLMGAAATEYSDFAVLTSDNPRSEDPQRIADQVIPGMIGTDYEIILDRSEAIAALVGKAKAGDTILIAGKGAENYQEINGVRHPFEDKKEIIAALKKHGYEN